MDKLNEDLKRQNEEKARQAEFAKKMATNEVPEPKPIEPPKITSVDPEIEFKRLSAQMELDSKAAGYKSFKEREAALKDGEKESEAEALALGQKREKFESEQAERVRVANSKLEEAKKAKDLYNTKIADANAKMEKAQTLQAEADRVLKAQSEAEKEANEKAKAYEANMTEAIEVFSEIATYVSRQGYSVGRILKYDVGLISRMQGRKVNLASIADVISADIGRISELCQEIQDKNLNPKLLEYLNSNVEWLETNLKIEWQPPNVEELK